MNVSKEMAASAEARDFSNPKAFFDLFKDLFHAVTTKILTPLTHQNADIALQYCKVSIALTTNDLLAINNGNRTEWSPIWSVIIRVINKIGRPRSGSPIC